MTHKHPLLVPTAVLILAALACNLPSAAGRTPTPSGPEATFTALAETLASVMTQTAAGGGSTSDTTPAATVTVVTPTNTPQPSNTPVPPTPIPCDQAGFVADVSVPDGSKFNPGQSFTKTWRLRNNGSCTWTTAYTAVFDSGNAMDAPAAVNLSSSVAPGQTVDISVAMKAPGTAGKYRGNWRLRNASGARFGLGASNAAFFVDIEVVELPTRTPTATNTSPPPTAGDLVLLEFFQSTGAEIIMRVANQPIGSLSGNFQYAVFAGGVQVRTGTCSIPTGSAACWTGYVVSDTQSIRSVIDPNNLIPETNEGNNQITLTCNGVSKACY